MSQFKQYKVEPTWTAGSLAELGWWVATPGDHGDLIVAEDVGPYDGEHTEPGARLYRERNSGKLVAAVETDSGLRAVAFPST